MSALPPKADMLSALSMSVCASSRPFYRARKASNSTLTGEIVGAEVEINQLLLEAEAVIPVALIDDLAVLDPQ